MEKNIINVSEYIKYQGKAIILETGTLTICMTLRSFWKNSKGHYCIQGDGCLLLEIDYKKALRFHLATDHDTLPIPLYGGGMTRVVPIVYYNNTCIVRELTQEEHKIYKSTLHSLMFKTKTPYVKTIPLPWFGSGYTCVF